MFAASDPSLLGLVMPDAKVVTGIQVSRSQASPFGQYILSEIKPGANFDKLAAAIGFDPRRDLQEIVAATASVNTSGDPASLQGLVLGRGTFQPAKIATAVQLGGATASTYKGFEILGTTDANKTGAAKAAGIVFLDASTVAIGDLATLKAAIDRRVAGTVFSGSVAEEAKEVSAANDAWFVSSAPSAFLAGKLPGGGAGGGGFNPANLLQAVIQTGGGARFTTSGIALSAEALTDSNQNAQALADLLRFGLSMIQVNRNSNPGAGKVASIADTATFAASGPLMRVTLTLPEQQVEQLLMPAAAQAQKKVAAR